MNSLVVVGEGRFVLLKQRNLTYEIGEFLDCYVCLMRGQITLATWRVSISFEGKKKNLASHV